MQCVIKTAQAAINQTASSATNAAADTDTDMEDAIEAGNQRDLKQRVSRRTSLDYRVHQAQQKTQVFVTKTHRQDILVSL